MARHPLVRLRPSRSCPKQSQNALATRPEVVVTPLAAMVQQPVALPRQLPAMASFQDPWMHCQELEGPLAGWPRRPWKPSRVARCPKHSAHPRYRLPTACSSAALAVCWPAHHPSGQRRKLQLEEPLLLQQAPGCRRGGPRPRRPRPAGPGGRAARRLRPPGPRPSSDPAVEVVAPQWPEAALPPHRRRQCHHRLHSGDQ
mmetsp:Transcript_19051/g.39695  ORF Transcript_19051/g.39695 Transcript_19051/m.39695 type:complete len:200 (+) Transcript_19051:206-805(+)